MLFAIMLSKKGKFNDVIRSQPKFQERQDTLQTTEKETIGWLVDCLCPSHE